MDWKIALSASAPSLHRPSQLDDPVLPDTQGPGSHPPVLPSTEANRLKYIAFYLPQFHPIPENDAAWGKGFTEWTNVAKAMPLFDGHYQPHLPTELGYYDLRLREVQHQQIDYAKRHGIDAFCFHYYWFSGRRVLERPIDDFLADPAADIEFCLCWANENWTRRWDGAEHELLIRQNYSPEDDIAFIADLLPYFRDPRYVRVNGAPVLLVYFPKQLPDAPATLWRWRQFCREHGIGEIHLVAALTHGNWEFESMGFDAGMEFPPHDPRVSNYKHRLDLLHPVEGSVLRFGDVAERYLSHEYSNRVVYRGLFPSWDNSARVQGRGTIVLDGTPDNYALWLHRATALTLLERPPAQQLVFINAWNEWAEGCHLEPDRRYGLSFLEATRRVKDGECPAQQEFTSTALLPEEPPAPEPVPESIPDPVPEPIPEPLPPPPEEEFAHESLPVTPHRSIAQTVAESIAKHPVLYRSLRQLYRITRKPHLLRSSLMNRMR